MTLRNAQPIRFSPAGLSDALAEEDAFPGACSILQNLIPDPTTKNMWVCRPVATPIATFPAQYTPVGSVVHKVIGPIIYGMLTDSFHPGKDRPYVFNILTGQFVTITGIDATKLPNSQGQFGDWTPPTMDLCGVNLVVTHPGFDGVQNFFGWFNVSDPTHPVWNTGNIQSTGAILALGVITGGSGYTNNTYTNVPLTGGSGTNAIATVVVSGGAVTSVTLTPNPGGLNYLVGDILSAAASSIGGTGSGFSVPVSSLAASSIQFTTVPSWVAQFNGRAYFGINPLVGQPSAVFTDPLKLSVTNSNQALTFGDTQKLTACVGLPLANQLGGIIQSLMVFKDGSQIAQILGDAVTSNLSVNALNVATGTLAPRSIVPTPLGLAFVSPDGVRIIDQDAKVSPPIGAGGSGISNPFINAIYPTRMAAGCNATVLRISVQNGAIGGAAAMQYQEYWYDLSRQVWSGPHTSICTCYSVYEDDFIVSIFGQPSSLFDSQSQQENTSQFVNSQNVALTWQFQTCVLADNAEMAMSEITEMQVKTSGVGGTPTITVNAQDENGNILNTFTYNFNQASSQWDSSQWDSAVWDGQQVAVAPRRIDFPSPTVYNRLAINITGTSAIGFRISDTYIRRRVLGYMQQVA